MAFESVRNALRGDARRGDLALTAYPRTGRVTSYDPSHMAVKVQIEPDGFETGWLPIRSPWAGPGWGLFAAPAIGAEVEVHFQEGGKGAGYVALSGWSSATPPLAVPSGELWLVHESGSFLKLTNDGKISINTTVELDVGNIAGTLHKIVTDALISLFNGHTHPTPNGISGPPNQQMGDAHLTQILKAN